MRRLIIGLTVLGTVVCHAYRGAEAAFLWTANSHCYEVVLGEGITWDEARSAAYASTYNNTQGYLATLTTNDELQFVVNSVGGAANAECLWVGGYQDHNAPEYSEPNGGWKWITEEPWNTGNDAPYFSFNNNYGDIEPEDNLIIGGGIVGGLNDYYGNAFIPNPNPYGLHVARGYIVEYNTIPEPCAFILLLTCAISLLIFWRWHQRTAVDIGGTFKTSTSGGKSLD